MLVVFPLCWHTDSYRRGRVGHGAFELCLPSLGILYQIRLLRTQYLGGSSRSGWSWGEDRRLSDRVTLPIVCGVCDLLPTIDVCLEVCGVGQARDYE